MVERNWLGVRTGLSYGEEWPNNTTITVVAANAFTTADANVAINDFAGQIAIVLENVGVGSEMTPGSRLHIVSNTASPNPVFTTEETLNTAGNDLIATDRLAISRIGINPQETAIAAYTTDEYLAVVDQSDLLEATIELFDLYAHGDANLPDRREGIQMKRRYEASMPVNLVNGKLLFYHMGYVEDNCSAFVPDADTLATAAYPGEKFVTVTAGGGSYINGAEIQIGDAAAVTNGPEIRTILDDTNDPVLELDRPLRRSHPILSITDICNPGYFTHTMDSRWAPLQTMCIEAVFLGYDEGVPALDAVFHYPGISWKSLKFTSNTDAPLVADCDMVGLSSSMDAYVRSTVVSTDWTSTPYHFRMATISVNGVQYHQTENIDATLERKLDTMYYHNSVTGIDPYENIPGRGTKSVKFMIPFHNKNLWTLVKAGANFDVIWDFERGTNDDLVITFKNCKITAGPLKLPDTGMIPQDIEAKADYVTIVVQDAIEYY